ncbi:hypothetical protein [Streptomyces sp. cmx-4-7]|uniref:hypothetical protein n=1 Tax=Streptomyces sp. cmx-4-7 TaxID=2790939 RepID=UPI00398059FA
MSHSDGALHAPGELKALAERSGLGRSTIAYTIFLDAIAEPDGLHPPERRR